jgi:hypothetical protein
VGQKNFTIACWKSLEKKFSKKKINFNTGIDLQNIEPKPKSEFVDLPYDKIDDDEITKFLDKLILAVNQPNESEFHFIYLNQQSTISNRSS